VKSQTATNNKIGQQKLAVKKQQQQQQPPYKGPNSIVPRLTNEKSHGSQQNWEIVRRECHKTPKKERKKS
jgi:hypothetical protein